MKKSAYLTAILFATFAVNALAQDIHFSQFYMSPLTLNPSLAGAQHDISANLNYKSQWASVSSPYKTIGFSYDMRLNRNKASKGFLAMGLNFFSDRAGDARMGTTQANLNIAYHVRINEDNLFGGGIQAGYLQRSVTASALKWGNQYDGTAYNSAIATTEPAFSSGISAMDFAGGLTWTYDNSGNNNSVVGDNDKKICIGVSMQHFSRPQFTFYNGGNDEVYMKYLVHGTAVFGVKNTNMAFVPGFMYAKQGPSQEIYAGTLVRFTIGMDSKYTGFKNGAAVSFGGFMRSQDAIAAVVQLDYANYTMGISYDVNTSGLTAASGGKGGIEISLRYVAPNPFMPGRSRALID